VVVKDGVAAAETDVQSMCLQDVRVSGVTQTVHVMVTTYGEAAEMIRECLIRLLAAPEPVYMEKFIYVCDDGHAKPEGPKKRQVVEELRVLGACFMSWIGFYVFLVLKTSFPAFFGFKS
jgi:hypothetical protein